MNKKKEVKKIRRMIYQIKIRIKLIMKIVNQIKRNQRKKIWNL